MKMPGINARIKHIVDERAFGNVSEFARSINIQQQRLERLFRVGGTKNQYPKPADDIIDAIANTYKDINKGWILLGEETQNTEVGKDVADYKTKYMALLEEVSTLKSKIIDLSSDVAKQDRTSIELKIETTGKAILAAIELQSQSFSHELQQAADRIVKDLGRR